MFRRRLVAWVPRLTLGIAFRCVIRLDVALDGPREGLVQVYVAAFGARHLAPFARVEMVLAGFAF